LSISGVADRQPRATVVPHREPEDAMKYLCLVYHEEARVDALPAREREALVEEVLAYREELRRGGYYLTSSPLEGVATAATVRVRAGKVSVTDGPFAETREQLGGFYLIEARDLNEAIRLASRMPPAKVGAIEVRPVRELDAR
jgi:hypothetical protein